MSARTRIALAAAVAALSLAVAAAPASAGTLDQQQTSFNSNALIGQGLPVLALAQTFAAGRSGGLDQVDLHLNKASVFSGGALPTDPLTVEIRDVSGGFPGSAILASATVAANDVVTAPSTGIVAVPLSSPVAVVKGGQYAIVAHTDATVGRYGWQAQLASADPYAAGAPFRVIAPATTWSPLFTVDGDPRIIDFWFKTYVAPWNFTGFYSPVNNDEVNLAKAGSSIPVKFSLGGNQGLDVLADDYPQLVFTPCNPDDDVDPVEETSTANNGLTYDAATDTYTYVWKTSKNWKGKCGTFTLKLDDDTTHTADFQFK